MDFAPQVFLESLQGGSIAQFIGNFLIVLVLFALIFFLGLRIGKRRLVALTVATYIGLTLYEFFPYKETIFSFSDGPFISLCIIILVTGICIFIPYRILARTFARDYGTSNQILITGIIATLLTTLLLASAYHILDLSSYYDFTPALDALFAPVGFFFWWFIAPLIVLFFTSR